MKTRNSLKQRPQTSQLQRQKMIYIAATVSIIIFLIIGIFLYLYFGVHTDSKAAQYTHYTVKRGVWEGNTSWEANVAPPVANIADNVDIDHLIVRTGDLSFASGGAEAVLTARDTLLIYGDLIMGNKSRLVIDEGAVLVISGNFVALNKIEINNGGLLAVSGNMEFPKSGQDKYNGDGGELYVGGEVNNNPVAENTAEPVSLLQQRHPVVYNYLYHGLSVMPVKLLYFKATARQDSDVLLEWATVEEENNEFFTVERSRDARNYEEIHREPGLMNSNVEVSYSFTDKDPYQGVSYYRLKQTDIDGKFEYSKVVKVERSIDPAFRQEALNILAVGPNPFDYDFFVEFELAGEGQVEFRLMNMQGMVVLSETIEGVVGYNRYTYQDRKGLLSGHYVLSVIQNNVASKPVRLLKR